MFLLLPSKLILGLLSETYGSISPYDMALVTATAGDDPAVDFSYDESISFSTSQPIKDLHRGYRLKGLVVFWADQLVGYLSHNICEAR